MTSARDRPHGRRGSTTAPSTRSRWRGSLTLVLGADPETLHRSPGASAAPRLATWLVAPVITVVEGGGPWDHYELAAGRPDDRDGRAALLRPRPPGVRRGRRHHRLRRRRRRHQRPARRRGDLARADRPLPPARRPEPRRHRRAPGRPHRLRQPRRASSVVGARDLERRARPFDHRLRPPRLARARRSNASPSSPKTTRLRAGRSHARAPRRHAVASSSRSAC